MNPQQNIATNALPGLIAAKFLKDYKSCVEGFSDEFKLELLEHLSGCLDLALAYLAAESEERWKLYQDREREFLKKYGRKLKAYVEKKFYFYYGDSCLLVEKEIYTPEEWNLLSSEKQTFSNAEFITSLTLSKRLLNAEISFLLLEQPTDQIQAQGCGTETQPGVQRRSKIRREAKDKVTSLNQEQTVLLFYYLQQQKVFLKDEYLSDKEAATAFEVLTGYSQNALRQNIGKFNLWITPANLNELERVLNRVKTAMEIELKRS